MTSVAPEYYSSKLKDYTEELVYIPYFILGDIDPTNKEAVEGVEHFVTVPAVINAHRVIVQSEDWRKVYINVMTKYAGNNTRSYWEKKIEGSGSPKLDRVKNLTAQDYQIPEDWNGLIERPDGGKKKIVLLTKEQMLGLSGSAEPALMAGLDVTTLPGDEKNFKITTNKDLERFRQLMEKDV